MARPPKGKPLTYRGLRLDDDVWAECQRLGKEHGTINEGMAAAQAALRAQRVKQGHHNPNWLWCERCQAWIETQHLCGAQYIDRGSHYELVRAAEVPSVKPKLASGRGKVSTETWKRGPRAKGDKTR